MKPVEIKKRPDGRITFTFSYIGKILKVFEGVKIYIDLAPRSYLLGHFQAKPKQYLHNFKDLRRKLVSRKYSTRQLKAMFITIGIF